MPSRGKLERRGLGHRDDRALAGRVGDVALRAGDAEDARDVDDRAAAGRAHRRDRRLHAEQRAGRVDREQPVPGLERLLDQRIDVDDPGVVHQDVERARGTAAAQSSGFGDVEVPVGHVEPVGAQPRRGRLAGVVEDVAGDHARALAREPLGVRGALAARAAGDERDATLEPHRATRAGRAARSSALWASRICLFQIARTMSIRESGTSISAKCAASARPPRRVEPDHARDELGLRGVHRELRPAWRREADEVEVLGADGQRQARGAQRHAVALADQAPVEERQRHLESGRPQDRVELAARPVDEVHGAARRAARSRRRRRSGRDGSSTAAGC